MPTDDLIKAYLKRNTEAADLDLKPTFDVDDLGDWLEIIKDIAAFANSDGGAILIGMNDDGMPSSADVEGALGIDPADVTNRVHKYTGTHFHAFEFSECKKLGHEICAIIIQSARIPLVFTRVETYEATPGRQKTIFSMGTVYFRRGAKSEPRTSSDDIRTFLDREIEVVKHSWLDGISKVVLPPDTQPTGPTGALAVQLTNNSEAPTMWSLSTRRIHSARRRLSER